MGEERARWGPLGRELGAFLCPGPLCVHGPSPDVAASPRPSSLRPRGLEPGVHCLGLTLACSTLWDLAHQPQGALPGSLHLWLQALGSRFQASTCLLLQTGSVFPPEEVPTIFVRVCLLECFS